MSLLTQTIFLEDDVYQNVKKYDAKLMIWGGISAFLQTDLVFIQGHVNTNAYINQILRSSKTFKHMDRHFGKKKWLFMQDGAPAHTSKKTMEYIRKRCLLLEDWPPNSPDLNPIEHLWSIMDARIQQKRPKCLDELKDVINETWNTIFIRNHYEFDREHAQTNQQSDRIGRTIIERTLEFNKKKINFCVLNLLTH